MNGRRDLRTREQHRASVNVLTEVGATQFDVFWIDRPGSTEWFRQFSLAVAVRFP